MPTSDKLYEAYVVTRERAQRIHDTCVTRGMSLAEIDANYAYREALADRNRAYEAWKKATEKDHA